MGIFTRKNYGPTGAADRIRDQTAIKTHPFLCQAIDVRCVIDARTVGTDGLICMVIGKDEHYVGPSSALGWRSLG